MTNYLPESRSLEVGNYYYSPTSLVAALNKRGGKHLLDSIEYGSINEQMNKNIVKSVSVGTRAILPTPKDSTAPPDVLAILAAAFCAAFDEIDKGVVSQTNDYVQLQQLNQSQSQAVLSSTTQSINQQENAEKIAAQVADYQKKMGKAQEIFGWVMFGVGMALMLTVMVVTVVSGFFDGGLSDAALPAEAEMLGDIEMTEMPTEASNTEAADPDLINTSGEEADVNSAASDSAESSESQQMTNEETDNTIKRTQSQTNQEAGQSARKWATRVGKILAKMTAAACLGSPMLMSGIVNLKVSKQLSQLSQAQAEVGKGMQVLEKNNMYFQFLQQLTQREGGILQEEISGASTIIGTFKDIADTWRQVSYGLANSV